MNAAGSALPQAGHSPERVGSTSGTLPQAATVAAPPAPAVQHPACVGSHAPKRSRGNDDGADLEASASKRPRPAPTNLASLSDGTQIDAQTALSHAPAGSSPPQPAHMQTPPPDPQPSQNAAHHVHASPGTVAVSHHDLHGVPAGAGPAIVDGAAPAVTSAAVASPSLPGVARALFAHPQRIAQLARQHDRLPLHFEIYEFAIQAAPQADEVVDVQRLVLTVQEAAQGVFPGAVAKLFGSRPSGLALPSSDVDIVLLGACAELANPGQGFSAREKQKISANLGLLRQLMVESGLMDGSQSRVINANVPIIKCKLLMQRTHTWVDADISMGAANGVAAVDFARTHVQAMTPLRPLVLVLKALLREHGLNDASNGGLSSYSLLNMVIVHLLEDGMPPSAVPACDSQRIGDEYPLRLARAAALTEVADAVTVHDCDLGRLLVGFLWRFGYGFDCNRDAVSVRQRGVVPQRLQYWKSGNGAKTSAAANSGGRLSLEDPQEPMRDIGGGTYRFAAVAKMFRRAHDLLAESIALMQQGRLQIGHDIDMMAILSYHGMPLCPRPSLQLGGPPPRRLACAHMPLRSPAVSRVAHQQRLVVVLTTATPERAGTARFQLIVQVKEVDHSDTTLSADVEAQGYKGGTGRSIALNGCDRGSHRPVDVV